MKYYGKEKCRILKEIRAEIARQNDIEWVTSECKHKGNCKGTCPKCGSGLLVHKSKKYRNKSFYTCDKQGSDPNCDFISWDLPIDGKVCPECGAYMVLKHFGKKAYPRCSNKDCVTNIRKTRKSSDSKKNDDEE